MQPNKVIQSNGFGSGASRQPNKSFDPSSYVCMPTTHFHLERGSCVEQQYLFFVVCPQPGFIGLKEEEGDLTEKKGFAPAEISARGVAKAEQKNHIREVPNILFWYSCTLID